MGARNVFMFRNGYRQADFSPKHVPFWVCLYIHGRGSREVEADIIRYLIRESLIFIFPRVFSLLFCVYRRTSSLLLKGKFIFEEL